MSSFIRSIPNQLIEPLAWLGNWDWIFPTPTGFHFSQSEIQELMASAATKETVFKNSVRSIVEESRQKQPNAVELCSTRIKFLWSKVLATGQKTIRLSNDWCEEFENTEINLTSAEYRQPFQTMLIQLPQNYAESRFVPGLNEYPEFVVLHHLENQNALVSLVKLQKWMLGGFHQFIIGETIESFLKNMQAVPPNGTPIQNCFRIALNAMLAMTLGLKKQMLEPTYEEKQNKRKLKERAKEKDKMAALRARLQLGMMPEVFQFDQQIKAFDVQQTEPALPPDHTGIPKMPHWRRGHYRRQAVGPGWTQHELIWIRPVLINAGQFKGDLKDTTTTYEAS